MSDEFDLSEPEYFAEMAPPTGLEATPVAAVASLSTDSAQTYLDTLNEGQRQAVEAIDGPVLVLAGAGTGKTRVLTTRIGHILMQGKAKPWEILAVTFTNKAAREMQERVGQFVGSSTEGWWVGTFHAICTRILRSHAELIGLKSNFTILDTDDQIRLIKQLTENLEIDEKRWPPRAIAGEIQRWKDKGLTPDKISDADAAHVVEGKGKKLYADYQERLLQINGADFGDLLLHCLTLFRQNSDVLKSYQHKFRYILVDEYQDTNVSQYLWLRLLAQTHKNICCVGDDDQSIYSWRGAEVGNILRFEKDFPGATVVRLERNYRSTGHILGAASGLISQNQGRLGKTLWTEDDAGEKVRVRGVWDGGEEARFVGDEIESQHNKGRRLNDMAVLVRASFQTREFEERLISLAIPYRVIGGLRFYERQENRDVIAYLRVIAQPDDDLAFERIINLPKRGLGPAVMQTLFRHSRMQGISLTQAVLELVDTDELKPKPRNTLRDLMKDFDRWRSLIGTMPHGELANDVIDQSGYRAMWKASKATDAPGRLDNLKEIIAAISEYETLGDFLEHVSLVMENEDSLAEDKFTLMTLHGAKGLEFDTVFLPGWEEGLFPHQRALDDQGAGGLEEERRLAYVGITRARKHAIITTANNRLIYGKWQSAIPSRFIGELPAEHVEIVSNPGLSGGDTLFDGDSEPRSIWAGPPKFRREAASEPKWRSPPAASSGAASDFKLGERVFHQKFGYGKIIEIDGSKLEINFEKAGTKKVIDSFVQRNP